MEYRKINRRLGFISKIPLLNLFCIFFLSFCALGTINSKNPCSDMGCPLTTNADLSFHDLEKSLEKANGQKLEEREEMSISLAKARRFLGGLGSMPPRCAWKCGSCTPCKPVHVPVPPGTPVTAEYYPEAWRCKCGNKLYMP